MARLVELSESELSTILDEKDAENTKKATKVTTICKLPLTMHSKQRFKKL